MCRLVVSWQYCLHRCYHDRTRHGDRSFHRIVQTRNYNAHLIIVQSGTIDYFSWSSRFRVLSIRSRNYRYFLLSRDIHSLGSIFLRHRTRPSAQIDKISRSFDRYVNYYSERLRIVEDTRKERSYWLSTLCINKCCGKHIRQVHSWGLSSETRDRWILYTYKSTMITRIVGSVYRRPDFKYRSIYRPTLSLSKNISLLGEFTVS